MTIADSRIEGQLIAISRDGISVMATASDVPSGLLGTRALGRVIKEQLAEAFQRLPE